MKLPARSVLWLLPFLLTGCFHKTQKAQTRTLAPAIAKTVPPSTTPVELPPNATTIPTQPTQNATVPAQPTRPPVRRSRPPSPAPAQATNTQPDANDNPGVSAMGQLSSGDPADSRRQAVDSINSTERSVNAINRRLTDSEQVTVTHIREFLKQAKGALASGDVDGARTLTAKAKVLLSELTTP